MALLSREEDEIRDNNRIVLDIPASEIEEPVNIIEGSN
jgi:hypothetical protein